MLNASSAHEHKLRRWPAAIPEIRADAADSADAADTAYKIPLFFGFALEIPKDYALLGAKAWRAVADSRFESSAMIPSALEPVNLYRLIGSNASNRPPLRG